MATDIEKIPRETDLDPDALDDDPSAIVALAKAVNRARIAYNSRPGKTVKIDDAMSRLLALDPSYKPRGGRRLNKKRNPMTAPRIFTLKRIADRLETTVGALLGEKGFEITEDDRARAGELAAWLTEKFRIEPGNSRPLSVKTDISAQSENVSPYPPRTIAKWTMAFPVEPNAFNDNGDTDYPLEMHWFELVAVLVASCASAPASTKLQPQSASAARVYVINDAVGVYRMMEFNLYIDGRRVSRMVGGEYVVTDIEGGSHRFTIEGLQPQDLDTPAGTVQYFRIDLPLRKDARLVPVEAHAALSAIKEARRVDSLLPQFAQ